MELFEPSEVLFPCLYTVAMSVSRCSLYHKSQAKKFSIQSVQVQWELGALESCTLHFSLMFVH